MMLAVSLQLHVHKVSPSVCTMYVSTRYGEHLAYVADSLSFEHSEYDDHCPNYTASLFKDAPTRV